MKQKRQRQKHHRQTDAHRLPRTGHFWAVQIPEGLKQGDRQHRSEGKQKGALPGVQRIRRHQNQRGRTDRRQHIIDTMIKDAEMRSKAKLIDGFIQKNVDEDKENFMVQRKKADGTSDLEERLNQYITTEREKAVRSLSEDEGIPSDVLTHYLKEYDYLQKEQPEIIQKALKEKHLGLIKTRKALTRILDRLRSIIRTFSWE